MSAQNTNTESEAIIPIRYCLYARKSSEDDERQALSIESQVKEVFKKVREVRKGDPGKTPIGTKEFGFTKMFKFGVCGGGITADENIQ